jgi:hypothetical protein
MYRAAHPRTQVKEDAGGSSATLQVSTFATNNFVSIAHLDGVHSGDIVTAILDHAYATAQLQAHT